MTDPIKGKYQQAAIGPIILDLNTVAGAREYIRTFPERVFNGREIAFIDTGKRRISFATMTDQEALDAAYMLYNNIELATTKGKANAKR